MIKLNCASIKLTGKIFSNYKVYTSERKKYVVLIDINHQKICSEFSDEIIKDIENG